MNDGKEILRDYSLTGVESKKTVELGLADAEWHQMFYSLGISEEMISHNEF